MNWKNRLEVKHLLTSNGDFNSVQKSMNAIADVIAASTFMNGFRTGKWRRIPKGDEVFGPVDYANRLLNEMYNFCDANAIWVE